MLVVIIVIIIVVVGVLYHMGQKQEEERKEAERQERIRKQKEFEAQQKAKYEVVTETEKQRWLANGGEELLNATLKMFEAAVKGQTSAMISFGIIFGPYGTMENPSKSFYWINKACSKGDTEAMYWLALYYLNGFGVKQDKMKGSNLMCRCAAKGNQKALKSLKEDFGLSDSKIREAIALFSK